MTFDSVAAVQGEAFMFGQRAAIYDVLVWLVAIAGVVVLWRLRGRRGITMLLVCLLVVFVAVIVWNSLVSFRAIH